MRRTKQVRTFRLNWRAVAVCAMVLLMFAALVAPTVVSAQSFFGSNDSAGGSGPAIAPPPDPNSIGTQTPEVEGQSSLVASVLTALLEGLISLLGPILTALISGVIWVSSYNDFVNALAVVNGWVVVRDIANMFFIIVLLIIAFGTILGQEDYHYKKLLPKFLLLAILINFSRTIVGVMIDFTQVVMLTFVNGYSAAAGGNFANIFHIVDLLQYKAANCRAGSLSGWSIFGAAALAFIMIVISITTVVVILTVLALRVIMLWLLIVLSPLAFLAGTFPQGQKYYAQWWEEFKNQAMVGPMLAFFLWLSLVTVGGGNAASQLTQNGKPIVTGATDIPFACSAVGSTEAMMSYIIGTMMLLIGVQMSQQMGGAVSGVAMRAKGAAGRALKYGGRALAAPIAGAAVVGFGRVQQAAIDWSTVEGTKNPLRRLAKYVAAPGQAFAGFFATQKERREEAKQRAHAAAQEEGDYVFTAGALKIPYLRLARDAQRAGLVKKFQSLDRQSMAATAGRLIGKKDVIPGSKTISDTREAVWLAATSKGYDDDIWGARALDVGRYAREYGIGVDPASGTVDWHNSILNNDLAHAFLAGADFSNPEEIAGARQHLMDNYKKDQSPYQTFAQAEDYAKQTQHPEDMYIGGEIDTKENLYKGSRKTGWLRYINAEGRIDHRRFYDENTKEGRKQNAELDAALTAGKVKYKKVGNRWSYYNKDTQKEYYSHGQDEDNMFFARILEQEDPAMREITKGGEQNIQAQRTHGSNALSMKADENLMPILGPDGQPQFIVGGMKQTFETRMSGKQTSMSETRRTELRNAENTYEDVDWQLDENNELTLMPKTKAALRRTKDNMRIHPQYLASMFAALEKKDRAFIDKLARVGIEVRDLSGDVAISAKGWAKTEPGAPAGGAGAPPAQPPPAPPGAAAPPAQPPPTPPVAPPAAPVAPAPAVPAPRVRARKGGRVRIAGPGRVVDVRGDRVVESIEGQRRKEQKIEEISEEEIRRIFGSVSIGELRGKGVAPEVISRIEQVRAAAPAPAAPAVRPAAPAPAAGAAPAPEIPAEAIVSGLAQSMQQIARQFDSLNIDPDLQNLTREQERAVKDAMQKVLKAVEKSKKTLSADTRRQIGDLREAMDMSQEKLWNFLRYKGINKYTFPEIMKQFMAGEGSEGGPGGGENA